MRRLLAAGLTVRATFVKLASLEVVDLLAATPLDAIVVDLEHSQLSEGDARRLVRHAGALGLPAVVRVPAIDPGQVNRLLEAGAAGIQLSTVVRRSQIVDLVSACRYPPAGRRSVSVAQPGATYGASGLAEVLATGRVGPLLIAQIETGSTEDRLVDLLAGVDVVFVGLTDLSVDLGECGAFDSPAMAARIREIAEAADAASGAPAFGGWVPTFGQARLLGVSPPRYLVAGSDLAVLAGALADAFRPPEGQTDNDQTDNEEI